MQLVNSFVYMPVTEIPGFVVQHLFYRIQPVLRTVVHSGLIYAGEEALSRYILERAGVRKNNIHRMRFALLLNILFNSRCRLLIRPPLIAHTQAIELVNTVSTTDHNTLLALYIEYIAVNRKQDIRKVILIQHTAAVPLLFLVGADILRSVLVVAVNAEKSGFQAGKGVSMHR